MPADTTDRRAMLREAYEAAAEEDEVPAVEEVEAEAEAPEAAVEAEPAAEAAEAAPEGETEEEKAARDDKGRFQAKDKAPAPKAGKAAAPVKAAVPATTPAAPAAVEAPKDPAGELKAPQSWTAKEREAWGQVPPSARQAIHRLEGETRRVMQETAQVRRERDGLAERYQQEAGFRQQVMGSLQPFEGIFRAQGMEPVQGAMNVVQTYAALHYGSREQKAGILANLIGQFSAVDDVNAVLSGQVQAPPAQAVRPPAAAPPPVDVRSVVREEFKTWVEQASTQRADRDLEAFLGSNPEFVKDAWDNMQLVLDSAHQRGRNLTYQQAYDLALKMDPEIQGILEQRAQATAATQPTATAATARARAAAATVRSRPASAAPAVDLNDRRAMLQRAAERARS